VVARTMLVPIAPMRKRQPLMKSPSERQRYRVSRMVSRRAPALATAVEADQSRVMR
jgi:hypothetical protein